MRKNRRDLGESEKLSDLNVSWLWVKEREKERRKEGRGEGGGKGGVKYLRFLYRPKRIWQGYYRVLEPKRPMRAVPNLPGMGEPEYPSCIQSLARKYTQKACPRISQI